MSTDNTLRGKTALITGGSKGIGLCIAEAMARQHMKVAITSRHFAEAQAAAKHLVTLGAESALALECDVRYWKAQQDVVAEIMKDWGRLDVVIANAGVGYFAPIDTLSLEHWHQMMDTNLTGGFLVARECYLQSMQAHGGAVVNIVADIWGSMPGMGHSGAARAGMVSFTETAAVEWAKSGVRVNAVAPGYIASSGMDHYPPEAGPMLREMRETVPLGRFGNEAETAAAITFLLSPAASFVSGSVLRVDGARPQVRMGWGAVAAPAEAQGRDAVKPFDGFHRYAMPKVFQ